ncbi:PQQ-dependent dehydrogenase, methanol/ethanol family [Emcibacter nanhaiensis]|uniref:PQQ-dependent dehydrogenase, methanol/ethanol family n=1 Tax=Emcibacter nanhaiensis TaxID=1505037 RepID=A0A501PCH0_9PROT|nr:PQQ-dependent dehydrogenase, methanol/ethanol family [Emcibacter nanhaiensis]TPD57878.1 PQQ-dependent dehydrogenase, methanol/ethanol family [Emcibacter nanhaiensis]
MMIKRLLIAATLVLAGCGGDEEQKVSSGGVDRDALLSAAGNTSSWLTYGRTYNQQRYSPAHLINQSNVSSLGLAWYADMDTARGQEATPLVIDGNLYFSTAWSKVKAYDGATGALLWEFDPEVPGETAVKGCCDVVNRGMTAWGDNLYFGTLDGRLISLDRKTGTVNWSVVTVDQSKSYTITQAPIAIDGKIIIGNSGAEMGVRGYITAYDAKTGDQLWRFYTVPDNPENGPQPEYLEKAVATWNGEWWKLGGGGTVWDSMAYDPDLDLLYIGVGNGSPWNQSYRSPGGGDNLYLSSIVALRPETGEYVWHYQTTPGETWDFTATQHIMLADMEIDGKKRKVLMQAPKNGFFYVLDRATGELISANNYIPVNWAEGIDMETGRPIEKPEARYYKTGKPFFGSPGASGGHNWQPMAYDPDQNLVFIPAKLAGFPYFPDENWKPAAMGFNVGIDMAAGAMPAIEEVRDAARKATTGALIAWDPVAQKARWQVSFPGPWNGGLLATGGGLVFQGNASSKFEAYASDTGKELWSFPAQTGILAAPVTYTIDGEQYVAVLAGWGGVWPLATGVLADVSGPVRNISRLLVFKLNGTAELPPMPPLNEMPLDPPPLTASAEVVAEGAKLFGRFCGVCHGDAAVAGGITPDLRYSGLLFDEESWKMVVIDGALKDNGMVSFAPVISEEQAQSIRHYVIKRANEDKALEQTE